MEVRALCPLVAWGFVWHWSGGRYAQTVVVKATFRLTSDKCQLADAQDASVEDDVYADGDSRRSLMIPSDKVPHKPHADVMLVGHAYAPKKQPVRSLMVRLVVGSLDKSIEVWCDRGFRLQDGQLREGPRFSKMPLCWERAAGGPETSNPVGIGFDAEPDAYGLVTTPNLQPPGMHVSQRSDTFAPVCFAPTSATWPSRTTKLGGLAGSFSSSKWDTRPIPDGFDFAYFQAAPPDQQIAGIRPNERIILENLHPEHPRLVTSLPGLQPRVVAERATGERENVKLAADTLRIDTDRGVCVVVWRGTIWLQSASEAGRIVVTLDDGAIEELDESDLLNTIPPNAAIQQDVQADDAEDLAGTTLAPGFDMLKVLGPVMPFLGQDKPQAALSRNVGEGRQFDAGLPFAHSGGSATLRAVEAARAPVSAESTISAPISPPAPRVPAMPTASGITENPFEHMPAVEKPIAGVAPPAFVRAFPLGETPSGAPVAEQLSVWAGGHRGEATPSSVTPTPAFRAAVTEEAARAGVAAASDAAARLEEQTAPCGSEETRSRKESRSAATVPKDPVRLVWFDPKYPAILRKHPDWQLLLAELDLERLEAKQAGDERDEEDETPEGKERRDVFAVLAGGAALDAVGLDKSFSGAIDKRGRFEPPLVLVAGDLELPFDELESLKATITMAGPAALGDKKLKETLDAVGEVVKVPGFSSATGLAEGLQRQVEEAFAPVGHRQKLAPDWLSVGRTRMLLSGRHYQRRTLRGKKWLRGIVRLSGGGMVTTYVPDELAVELPMMPVVQTRGIGEMEGAQEIGEVGRWVLFLVGLGITVKRLVGR